MPLQSVTLDALTIDDEPSFGHVGLYGRLKRALRQSGHRFLVPSDGETASWDRAVFLNLTYWDGTGGDDVLCDDHLPADVVAHVAFHHVVAQQLGPTRTAAGVLFAESIASAFDLYLVGRLLTNAPDSEFITTQVPIMSEAAEAAGASEDEFAALMDAVMRDPEAAFEDLRRLLFDAATALHACRDASAAQLVLEGLESHRFAPLLHHYQLSNWILYARAYAADAPDDTVARLDAALRQAPVAIDWIDAQWVGEV